MTNKISVVIIVKNGEKTIEKSLNSLQKFNEIIVYDNGSTDATIKISQKFKNVKLVIGDFIGFGETKNKAILQTKNDWVLSVDSDEVFPIKLVDEILNKDLRNQTIYNLKRDNYYNQKLVCCCGWGNDFVLRLFNKNTTKFNNNKVHEHLIFDNLNIEKLQNSFNHYTFNNAEELILKMNHYSNLWAIHNLDKKTSSPTKAIAKAMFAFIKCYVFKVGFLNGYQGFLISLSNANGVFYKYIKLYEMQNEN